MTDNRLQKSREEEFINNDPQYNFGGWVPPFAFVIPPSPSPTPSPTASMTPTPSITPTLTPTPTGTPTPTPTPSSIPFDVDAAAYLSDVISNGGIGIDATISGATETLFLDLKSNGLYTKLYAFYPLLGATSGSTALNAIRDNYFYDLTYNNVSGFTFNSSGATGDGLTAWANTNFNNTDFLQDNMSMGLYQFTQNTPTKTEEVSMGQSFGATNLPHAQFGTRVGSNRILRFGSATAVSASAGGLYNGFYVASRTTSAAGYLYRNGNTTPVLSATTTYTEGGNSRPIAVWNFYQNIGVYGNGYSNQGYSFIFLGEGLSSAEVATFSSIVNTFQTTLGRNTY